MNPLRTSLSLLIIIIAFGIPLFGFAQITGLGSSDEALTITTNPPYPKPGDLVTISIESFSFDLNAANVTWLMSGKAISGGKGERKFSFTAGALGEANKITLLVEPLNASPIQRELVIRPSSIDLIWQAKTYTPPFYKGKALFTGQSSVVVAAVAQFGNGSSIIPANNLIYRWKQGDSTDRNQSGYGKQGFTMIGNLWGREDVVTVSVSSADGLIASEKMVKFSPQKPFLLIYEDNPLLGVMYNRAITGTFNLNRGTEASFFAAPYNFISGLLANGNTVYEWRMNGKSVSDQIDGNTITFRDDSGGGGVSNVVINASQPKGIFQNSSSGFSINFK